MTMIYFFLFLLLAPLGGVTGRPVFKLYWNLRLSAGFKIWNEHINESSTDIIAPGEQQKNEKNKFFLSAEKLRWESGSGKLGSSEFHNRRLRCENFWHIFGFVKLFFHFNF